jgi:hypothetical protein
VWSFTGSFYEAFMLMHDLLVSLADHIMAAGQWNSRLVDKWLLKTHALDGL